MAVTKYLDKTGLTYLWGKIKAWCNATFALISHTHNAATTSANGFLSSTDKTKLNSLSQYPRFTYTAFNFIPSNSGTNYINQNSNESILTHLSTTQESVLRFKAYKGLSLTFEQPNIQSDAQYNDFHFVIDGAHLAGDGLIGSAGTLSVPEYEGATASANATSGLVPPALKAERSYFLKGDGTWGDLSSKAEDNNVVHKTGNETIEGNKTFSSSVIASATPAIKRSDNTGKLVLVGGSNAQSTSGAKLYLNGSSISETGLVAGGFCLQAGNSSGYHQLNGCPDGQLFWDGPDVTVESNIPRIRLKNTAVDSSVTSNTTRFTGSISFADSASSSTLDFNRRTGVVMSGINSNDASFIHLLAYDPEPNSDTYAGVAVGYPRNGSPYAVAPSTLSTRTNGTDIVTRDWIPNDTRIVHTTSNETIAGTKTFSSSPIVPTPTAGDSSTKIASTAFVGTAISNNDSGVVHKTGNETIEGEKTFKGYNKSPIHVLRNKADSGFAAGELAHVFYAEMLSGSTGSVSFGCSPISLIGNDTETNYNVGVRLGSTNGMTLVTAGECATSFTSATSTYNNENIYLTADGTIRMFVGCSNDATSYAGPVVISGTATAGGTGSTTTVTATNFAGNASTATKLATARSLTTKLDSTTAITFDGSANKDNIPVTGVLPIANGGTGSSTKNFVDLTTDQEISGIKTHKNHIVISEGASVLTLQMTNLDATVTSTTNKIHSAIAFNDKNDILIKNRTAVINSGITSSDENFIRIAAYDPAVNSTAYDGVTVFYPRSGTPYVTSITPSSISDDSTKIATTAWVRDATGNFACNAATATKLNTARTINGVDFDGSADITVADSTKLPLAGGTLTGSITIKRANPYIYFVETDWERGGTVTTTQYQGIYFQDKNSVTSGSIHFHYYTNKGCSIQLIAYDTRTSDATGSSSLLLQFSGEGKKIFRPATNNDIQLGHTDYRWSEIWCTQNSINSTSDERLKNSIDWIPENVLDAWENVNWIQFKYNDASQEKGIENARIHTGMIAQQIKTVFEKNSIDINKYGFFLYDKWEAKEAEYDKEGNLTTPAREAGDQYGLRYTEVLCIEAAYQRRKNKILENRISELEKQVSDMIILLQNLTNGNG